MNNGKRFNNGGRRPPYGSRRWEPREQQPAAASAPRVEADYRLATAKTGRELVAVVRNFLATGYTPCGGLVVVEGGGGQLFTQAVFRRGGGL